jgi:uncharacterized protein YueI
VVAFVMVFSYTLQQRLDKGMYGTPLVNPEEQHKYMGTFRERCRLSMTLDKSLVSRLEKKFLIKEKKWLHL